MFTFIFQKMRNKKWMVFCLLIGNILLISIACCNSVYTRSVLQKMLISDFDTYSAQTNRNAGTVFATAEMLSRGNVGVNAANFYDIESKMDSIEQESGVPAVVDARNYYVDVLTFSYDISRNAERETTMSGRIGFLSDLQNHGEIISGQWYTDEIDSDGCISAVISERMMVRQTLVIGDTLTVTNRESKDGKPIRVKVVGIFRNSSDEDLYWIDPPSVYTKEFFVSEPLFYREFIDKENQLFIVKGSWNMVLDVDHMDIDGVDQLTAYAAEQPGYYKTLRNATYRDCFSSILATFSKDAAKVRVTLLVLQVPIYILLGVFIYMVSKQMLEMEQAEISIMKSRGASRGQILSTYFMQSVIVSVVSAAAGIPLSFLICQVIGSSNEFLEFVSRKPLPTKMTPEVLLFAAAAAVFSIAVMVLPVISYSKVSIVAQKQKKNTLGAGTWWQKIFLDVVIFLVAIYGYYTFNQQKEFLAKKVADGAALDPLLYLSSSLFIIGAGMVALRVIPLVIKLAYLLIKRFCSPSVYASFLRVIRTKNQQNFIIVFLILTIAMGIFDAKAARTINSNEEEMIRYSTGADIVLREQWADNRLAVAQNPDLELTYIEPDFGKYKSMEDVQSIAKVYSTNEAYFKVDTSYISDVQLMGIDTKDFGNTAYMTPGLLDKHWFNYLNEMSQSSSNVLISTNMAETFHYGVGDSILYKTKSGQLTRAFVCGIVPYFPSYNPSTYSIGEDGAYVEGNNYLIVAHLSALQSANGVEPYEVWIKTKGESSRFIYDFAEQTGTLFEKFKDTRNSIIALKNDPIFQGTNGILTVGFIVVLILCVTGFLIFWILSIQSRALQFGILRAMGMKMREIIEMLVNEQFFITGSSILVGILVGEIASDLFIPLIRISYAAYDEPLPMVIAASTSDIAKMFLVIGAMILISMLILGFIISRIRITQALKLGED
ncbi:MAG: ABC transporter permease [Clostridia bacterium]|nr:ABC transporter permease [Clostridia bacterium]